MVSLVAWLDVSADEQRRMREIAALFTMEGSVDELGLGVLRDGISDALFPGTSTLHTRARYALIVPWCFQYAARSKPESRSRQLDHVERAIIEPLKRSADENGGILGQRAGSALKNLPSAVYWGMLEKYGILSHPATRDEALAESVPARVTDEDGTSTISCIWSVPPMPSGFPQEIPQGLALTHDEASWLRDAILEHTRGSLLAHLVLHRPDAHSEAPWLDAAARTAPDRALHMLSQAEGFSAVMHGAQLLYNLLLAEEAVAIELRDAAIVDEYRGRLAAWADDLTSRTRSWQLADLLDALRRENGAAPSPSAATREFITRWSDLVRNRDPRSLPDDDDARDLIRRRERVTKGAKRRLGNQKRLETWSGAAGAGRLTFRWGTVHRIVMDIYEGLQRA